MFYERIYLFVINAFVWYLSWKWLRTFLKVILWNGFLNNAISSRMPHNDIMNKRVARLSFLEEIILKKMHWLKYQAFLLPFIPLVQSIFTILLCILVNVFKNRELPFHILLSLIEKRMTYSKSTIIIF